MRHDMVPIIRVRTPQPRYVLPQIRELFAHGDVDIGIVPVFHGEMRTAEIKTGEDCSHRHLPSAEPSWHRLPACVVPATACASTRPFRKALLISHQRSSRVRKTYFAKAKSPARAGYLAGGC